VIESLKRIFTPRLWLVGTTDDRGVVVLGVYWRKKTAEREAKNNGRPYNTCVGPVRLGFFPKYPLEYHLGYIPALGGVFDEVTYS
jgi:hypothetical protein